LISQKAKTAKSAPKAEVRHIAGTRKGHRQRPSIRARTPTALEEVLAAAPTECGAASR
jgi:hypothetical protein